MDTTPAFDLVVSQNRYLSPEDDEIHAALVVTAEGAARTGPPGRVAQVIAIDCSGSMAQPPTRISAARRATRAAIDALRDGALFAVIEGTHTARQVYPAQGLAEANAHTRHEAGEAVRRLRAVGGTAIGEWLTLARHLLAPHRGAVRHVILLTDGRNNQTAAELDDVLATCAPEFSCDARGIGADWRPRELLRVAEALHGTADAVREPAELAADFAAMTRSAMDKLVPELRIMIRTTPSARLRFLRQTHPAEAELTGVPIGAGTTSFTTGSWAPESREYHLSLRVDPTGHAHDTDLRVARVDLGIRPPGAETFRGVCDPGVVLVHWTDDLRLSSRIDPRIAHYTGQTDLRLAVLRGCDAHDRGDLATAETEWGTAMALATRLDNEKVLVRLRRLVDTVGAPEDGVVRVRNDLPAVDLLSMAVGSTLSSRIIIPPPPSTNPDVSCPDCGLGWPSGALFCGGCGERIGGGT